MNDVARKYAGEGERLNVAMASKNHLLLDMIVSILAKGTDSAHMQCINLIARVGMQKLPELLCKSSRQDMIY